MAWLFWRSQRWELRFSTGADRNACHRYFASVHAAIVEAGWQIREQQEGVRIEARPRHVAVRGERISIAFEGHEVLVASICDPRWAFRWQGGAVPGAPGHGARVVLADSLRWSYEDPAAAGWEAF